MTNGKNISLLNTKSGKTRLFLNLRTHAKKLLREHKESGVKHVVFGVNRNSRGHLGTFFLCMTDAQLEAYQAEHFANNTVGILAVHA